MCGPPAETEMEAIANETAEKLEEMVNDITEKAQKAMSEDPDCQPYTKNDIDDKNMTIDMMINALEMLKTSTKKEELPCLACGKPTTNNCSECGGPLCADISDCPPCPCIVEAAKVEKRE